MRSSAAWRYAPLPPPLRWRQPNRWRPARFSRSVCRGHRGIRDGGRGCTVSASFYSRRYGKRGLDWVPHRTAPVPHDPTSLALRRAWSPAGDDAIRSGDGAGRAAGEMGHVLNPFLIINAYSLRYFSISHDYLYSYE